jgi:hypothetical protein
MKHCLMVCALTVGLLATAHYAVAQALTPAQLALKAKLEGVPEIPYEAVPNFLKLPEDLYFGESVGVATNSKGHTFVYDRGHQTRIFEFDQSGKFLHFVGAGLYGLVFAHVLSVDPQENLWAVDEGSNMELDGTVVGKFGEGGRMPGELTTIHEIDCRNDNEVTVAEITGWSVQRFKLYPKTQAASR